MTDNTLTSNETKTLSGKIKAIYPHIVVGGSILKPCYSIEWYDIEKGEMIHGCSSFSLPFVYKWLQEDFEVIESDIEDLINRQKSEIERWKEKYERLLKSKEQLEAETNQECHSLYAEKRTLEAMVDELQSAIGKEFTCFVGNPHKTEHCPYFEELEKERAEAVKEFAERLKEKAWHGIWEVTNHVDVDDIDNLVKEMVGDSDAT